MTNADIRWQQRLQNFCKALAQLDEAMALMQLRELSKLEKQGVIQAFEYSYELAWNTLKDFLVWQGIEDLTGSRDTIREAFSKGLIEEGQGWMNMLVDRNRTPHTYNEETAEAILANIRQHPPAPPCLAPGSATCVARQGCERSMSDNSKTGLPEATIQSIRTAFSHFPGITQAILYGSRAKGTFRPGSDIDLTLKGELDDADLVSLCTELDDLLLPYKFDLSLYRYLDNPALLHHIERVGQVFYARTEQS